MHNATVTAMRWSGLLAWLCIALPIALNLDGRRDAMLTHSPLELGVWTAAYLGFGLLYLMVTRDLALWLRTGDPAQRPLRLLGCSAMTGCALLMGLVFPVDGDLAITLILVCALLPGLLRWAQVKVWIGLQSVALCLLLVSRWGGGSAVYTGLFLGAVQGFTALLVHLLTQERLARRELGELHIQLRFARAQLEDAAREAERLRISRELHDSLGHHLTVLGLELEFAAQVANDPARLPISRARTLNKLLLGDVRESVHALRTAQDDWAHLTQTLLGSIPGLHVHLDCPAQYTPDSPQQARTLLRFFQEAMTNTVRHAQASRLWLRLERRLGLLVVCAHDNGRLTTPLQPGHGLTGLRERFEALGGELRIGITPKGALRLEGQFPVQA